MSYFLKFTAIVLAIVCSVSLFAQTASKRMPGAALYVYNINNADKPAPGAEPINVIVDSQRGFNRMNLSKYNETYAIYNRDLHLVWTGYIYIEQEGVYIFSLNYNDTNNFGAPSVIFQINDKNFLKISLDQRLYSNSCSVRMGKGYYKLTFMCRATGESNFSVRMWNKATPLKKIDITPASLYHEE